jgi:hypothetical protein
MLLSEQTIVEIFVSLVCIYKMKRLDFFLSSLSPAFLLREQRGSDRLEAPSSAVMESSTVFKKI